MPVKKAGLSIYSHIYTALLDVVPDLLIIEASGKSVVPGYMDLNLDILDRCPERFVIALSHYYKHPSGDTIADPDMEIAVYPKRGMAEALAYQDSWGYRRVYDDDFTRVNIKAKRELNTFLRQWLRNLMMQGHKITIPLAPV